MGEALRESAGEIVEAQKRLVPVRTGKLRDSIKATSGNGRTAYAAFGGSKGGSGDPDLTIRITAGNSQARHAALVEFGTAPHKTGGRFPGAQHPGTPARPYFFGPYRARRRALKSKAVRNGKKAIKRIAES